MRYTDSILKIFCSYLDILWNKANLELHKCKFSGEIPTEFGKLKKLEYLKLNDNNLGGEFPKMLTTLPKLKTLHLNRNQFRLSLPPSIGSIGNETMQRHRFELQNNDFSGKIPPQLGRINSLGM